MEKLNKLLIIFILLTPFSSAVSVGASPGFIDLGEVQPGTSQEVDFYITTNMDEEFQVKPVYNPTTDYADGQDTLINMENVSEQGISGWIDFSQDSYTIDPTTEESAQLPDGTSVNAEGSINMEINVPSNAEPGYKMGKIDLRPTIAAEGSGAGARVVGQTVPGFAFKVPGVVQRNVEMTGFNAIRIGERQVQMISQFRNTGTVTTQFNGGEFEIYDSNGNSIGNMPVAPATLGPGEYAEVDRIWRSSNIEGGEYDIEGIGDYTTGEVYLSGNFVITDTIQERQAVEEPSGGTTEEQTSDAPIIMIVILSLLLATLLYLMDIELTWIIILAGGTAVSLFILLGSVSNVLVLIPLLSIGIMLYV